MIGFDADFSEETFDDLSILFSTLEDLEETTKTTPSPVLQESKESLDSSSTNRNINNDLMFFVILYSIFIFSLFSSFVIVIYRMITGVYCRSNNEANANE